MEKVPFVQMSSRVICFWALNAAGNAASMIRNRKSLLRMWSDLPVKIGRATAGIAAARLFYDKLRDWCIDYHSIFREKYITVARMMNKPMLPISSA